MPFYSWNRHSTRPDQSLNPPPRSLVMRSGILQNCFWGEVLFLPRANTSDTRSRGDVIFKSSPQRWNEHFEGSLLEKQGAVDHELFTSRLIFRHPVSRFVSSQGRGLMMSLEQFCFAPAHQIQMVISHLPNRTYDRYEIPRHWP